MRGRDEDPSRHPDRHPGHRHPGPHRLRGRVRLHHRPVGANHPGGHGLVHAHDHRPRGQRGRPAREDHPRRHRPDPDRIHLPGLLRRQGPLPGGHERRPRHGHEPDDRRRDGTRDDAGGHQLLRQGRTQRRGPAQPERRRRLLQRLQQGTRRNVPQGRHPGRRLHDNGEPVGDVHGVDGAPRGRLQRGRPHGRQDRARQGPGRRRPRAHRESPRGPEGLDDGAHGRGRRTARGRGRQGRLVHQRMGRLAELHERLARHGHLAHARHLRAGSHVGSPGPPRHRQGHVEHDGELRPDELGAGRGLLDPQRREVRTRLLHRPGHVELVHPQPGCPHRRQLARRVPVPGSVLRR